MRRYLFLILLSVMASITFLAHPASSEDISVEAVDDPLSPRYLEWIAQNKSGDSRPRGFIPFPADLSHLADNPPDESLLYPPGRKRDSEIPSTYDLRNVDGKSYVTSVKSQSPYGTCWAHAAIGAMESNFLKNGGSELDLSEMHLAYFTFVNSDSSKTFTRQSSSSVLDEGGHSFFPVAIYSRLDGPVLESEVPYLVTPTYNTPESYTRVLRLRDVYYLTFATSLESALNVKSNETQRNIVKRRIMENGAVVVNYYDEDNAINSSTAAYFYTSEAVTPNHAVLIVGWDDNYSRSNFKTNPGMDGAWLIKNSWGTSYGQSGYMWMSYANYLDEGSTFTTELANSDMKAYYYDALGWTGSTRGWDDNDSYMANAFKATRENEKLIEVSFYTTDNNQSYEISIYTGLGTSMPSSPIAGTLVASQSGTIPFAGYHTITLNSPVSLTQNQYFSVVLKYVGCERMPISNKVTGFSTNFSVKAGSYFSYNGTSWVPGTLWSANAPLKAFTVTQSTEDTAPTITTTSLSAASLNTAYTAILSASGATPITWSISGDLPSGFELDSSMGMITGSSSSAGTYTFTVIASNDYGYDTQELTLSITDTISIATQTITGYVGYAISDTLTLSNNDSAVWSLSDGTLPKGLKLNASTGGFTGKPKKAGTYSVTFTAETSSETVTGGVTFTINEKPVKASVKTSSLTQITIGDSVNETLKVTGTEPITLSIIEGMPAGLNFDASTYTFSGTPTVTGKFTIKMSVSNIVNTLKGKSAATKKIKLIVKAKAPKINAPSSLPYGIVGNVYDGYTVQLSSGSSPDKWNASGLPKGLTISTTSGEITGTPSKAGSFNVKLKAKNSAGSDSTGKIPLVVYDTPITTAKKLKNGKVGKAYSVKLTVKNVPTSWDITGLPSNFSYAMNDKGKLVITGTPVEAGSYSVVVGLANPAGSSSKTLPLTIKGTTTKVASEYETEQYTLKTVGERVNQETAETNETTYSEELTLMLGETRGIGALTQSEREVLEREGYIIAAVLPELSVDVSEMYDLDVELDESAETGKKLVWLAFPRNAEGSEDDEIAEFFDEDGQEISEVPESHVVKVSVWLNEGVIYAPVIAVKK